MYRLALAFSALILAACAASDPPVTSHADTEPVPATAQAPAETGQIEFTEAPSPQQQDVPVQANVPEVICQLERRTGTNRKVRVCREQTSSEDAAAARATFDALRRQQVTLDE